MDKRRKVSARSEPKAKRKSQSLKPKPYTAGLALVGAESDRGSTIETGAARDRESCCLGSGVSRSPERERGGDTACSRQREGGRERNDRKRREARLRGSGGPKWVTVRDGRRGGGEERLDGEMGEEG